MKSLLSLKTTVLGILTGLALIIPQLINMLDDDPETIFVLSQLGAGLAAMGFGWFARDANISSEGEKVK